jgi:hypothetical protein
MKELTTEEAYNLGAQAMQSHIVAVLMMHKTYELAPTILGMKPPRFQLPEQVTIETKKEQS